MGEQQPQSVGDAESLLSPQELREKKVRHAKRAVRPELSVSGGGWSRFGHAANPSLLCVSDVDDSLPRVDCRSVSVEAFRRDFEEPRRPCVLLHATDGWPAAQRGGAAAGGDCDRAWTWDGLRRRFGAHRFKVGADDEGCAVRLPLAHFVDYVFDASRAGACADDSPLYIFDGSFADKPGSKALASDYSVPSFFPEDLFALAGPKRRPPHRWLVLGPRRSGSGCHVDPLATGAWNALLQGRKRWALLPPGTPRPAARPRAPPGGDGEPAGWFAGHWGAVRAAHRAGAWPHGAPLECVQTPGDVVFVPPGWWHAVLNLDHTVAVTHNYVGGASFDNVWRHTAVARPRLAAAWLRALRAARPDLAERAAAAEARGGEVSESPPSSPSATTSSDDDDDDDGEREEGDPAGGWGTAKRPRAGLAAGVEAG